MSILEKKTSLNVDIDIAIKGDALSAHNCLINHISLSAKTLPVYKRIDPDDPNEKLNIGDVCFIPIDPWLPKKSKKTVIRDLVFCRNNVVVVIRNTNDEDKEDYPDLGKIALFIDNKLKQLLKGN